MTTAIDRPVKLSYVLVEFQYGDDSAPLYYRVTNKTSAVQMYGNEWASLPDFKLTLPEDNGTLNDAQATIEARRIDGFLTDVSSEDPFSYVRAVVMEVTDSEIVGEAPEVIFLFRGFVAQAFRNPGGHSESVKLVLGREVSRMGFPAGLVASLYCQWTFTKRGCYVDGTDLEETGTLTVVTGKRATITGLADHSADPTQRYWHRGWVALNGARVQIRDWAQGDATHFFMREELPASWIGQTVSVFPGCDKSSEVCDQRWGNLGNYMGAGKATPSYHPVFENPA